MTRQELAALACKIIAIYIFFQVLYFAAQLIYVCSGMFFRDTNVTAIAGLITIVPVVILAALGLLFWKGSNWFASKMVSDNHSPVGFTSIGQDGLLTIAFAVLGAYAIIKALSTVTSQLFLRSYYEEWTYSSYKLSWDTLISSLVWLVAGLWLMFGSKGLAKIVLKIRRQEEEIKES